MIKYLLILLLIAAPCFGQEMEARMTPAIMGGNAPAGSPPPAGIVRSGAAVSSNNHDTNIALSITPADNELVVVVISAPATPSAVGDGTVSFQRDVYIADAISIWSYRYGATTGAKTITATTAYGYHYMTAQRYTGVAATTYVGTSVSNVNAYHGSACTGTNCPWTTGATPDNYTTGNLLVVGINNMSGSSTSHTYDSPFTYIVDCYQTVLSMADAIATSTAKTAATGYSLSSGELTDRALMVEYKVP